MDIRKFIPWNWFKKEEEETGSHVPVTRSDAQPFHPEDQMRNPVVQLHREMDRLFELAFRGFGGSSFGADAFTPVSASGLLKPQVDISAADREYTITVEVPGIGEKDVDVEIADNVLTIKGEKKQEKEEKNKKFYRMERSYGSFQRILALPEDADQEHVKATFRKGVLAITIPRKALPESEVKQIEIINAD